MFGAKTQRTPDAPFSKIGSTGLFERLFTVVGCLVICFLVTALFPPIVVITGPGAILWSLMALAGQSKARCPLCGEDIRFPHKSRGGLKCKACGVSLAVQKKFLVAIQWPRQPY